MPAVRGETETAVDTVTTSLGPANATSWATMPEPVTVSVPDQARESQLRLNGTSAPTVSVCVPGVTGPNSATPVLAPGARPSDVKTGAPSTLKRTTIAVQLEAEATTSAASAPSVVTTKSCAGSQAGAKSRLQGATPTSMVAAPAGCVKADRAAVRIATVEATGRNIGNPLMFMFN